MRSLVILFSAVIFIFVGRAVLAADAKSPFLELAGEHFRVRYTMSQEKDEARLVLRRAEEYYLRVAADIGYSRYQDFWTWDRRVVVTLYPDQYAYARFTGFPAWSKGYASRDTRIFRDHEIVSYAGQDQFIDEILPHEITHLMFWDYLRQIKSVPVWFEEGLAQLHERGARDLVQEAMRPLVRGRKHIPFASFQLMTITGEQDSLKVSLFYAQSLSIVVFLIQKYGKDAFHRLCRELRDGQPFEAALARAYPSLVMSLDQLEDRWVRSFSDE